MLRRKIVKLKNNQTIISAGNSKERKGVGNVFKNLSNENDNNSLSLTRKISPQLKFIKSKYYHNKLLLKR